MTKRYGIIGSGLMGQEHIRFLNRMDGVAVTAVADPDPGMRDEAARLAGAEAFSDHRTLLSKAVSKDLIDALIISSPNHTHHDIAIDAMATDLPILVEKPLCSTVEDAKRVRLAALGRSAPVWVAPWNTATCRRSAD